MDCKQDYLNISALKLTIARYPNNMYRVPPLLEYNEGMSLDNALGDPTQPFQ